MTVLNVPSVFYIFWRHNFGKVVSSRRRQLRIVLKIAIFDANCGFFCLGVVLNSSFKYSLSSVLAVMMVPLMTMCGVK